MPSKYKNKSSAACTRTTMCVCVWGSARIQPYSANIMEPHIFDQFYMLKAHVLCGHSGECRIHVSKLPQFEVRSLCRRVLSVYLSVCRLWAVNSW